MNRSAAIFGVAGVMLVAVVVVYGWRYLSEHKHLSPDELEKVAMEGGNEKVREQAALDLVAMGLDALPNVRRLLEKSNAPEVRAACISGVIQNNDWASVPRVLDDLDNESPLVRARAAALVLQMLCFDPTINPASKYPAYNPNSPAAERKPAIVGIRDHWSKMEKSPRLKELRDKTEERLKGIKHDS